MTTINELMMAEDLFHLVEEEKKVITIRKGYRSFLPGQKLTIKNVEDDRETVDVKVTRVEYTLAKYVSNQVLELDGFSSYKKFINGMKQYYPDFNTETQVTIVYWKLIRE
jgi:hypothetical protein